jgi:sodium/hydrogen exchanger 10/11
LVFFNVMMKLVQVPPSDVITPNEVIGDFLFQAGIGALWGVGVGVVASFWLARVFNNPVIEITITLSSAYLTFYSAEVLGCSGVLAVVALGLFMGKEGSMRISPEVVHFLEEFWEMLAFLGNTVVFVIAGLVMAYRLDVRDFSAYDAGVLLLLYVLSFVIRAVNVTLVWWFERRAGRTMDWRDAVVTTWGGLRGAMGLALALLVFYDTDRICERVRQKVLLHTSGIVFLTVVVNAISMRQGERPLSAALRPLSPSAAPPAQRPLSPACAQTKEATPDPTRHKQQQHGGPRPDMRSRSVFRLFVQACARAD